MESDKNLIIQNFFEGQEIVDSLYAEKLKPLKLNYIQEISRPGCTPCIMNAAKKKYSEKINSILSEDITPEKEAPDSFDPFSEIPMP